MAAVGPSLPGMVPVGGMANNPASLPGMMPVANNAAFPGPGGVNPMGQVPAMPAPIPNGGLPGMNAAGGGYSAGLRGSAVWARGMKPD